MTTPASNDIKVNRHALGIVSSFAFDATALVLQFSLSSLLFGVLTILAVSAVFLLLSLPYLDVHSRRIDSTLRNSRRRASSNTPIKIPLLSTVILYASTTVYMAGLIWNWTSVTRIIAEANDGLLSDGYDGHASLLALENAVLKQSWMATIALGVNVILGDAVVWWRACVIWQHRAVYYTGPVLLALTTMIFGLIGASQPVGMPLTDVHFIYSSGAGAFADVAAALSLVTNLTATSLIAVKTFLLQRRLKKYLGASGSKTRVLKVLALFIESGSVYCIILLVVLIYQCNYDVAGPLVEAGYFFIYGCLRVVPVAAIYPTVTIVLTAVNCSPLDLGLASPLDGHSGEALPNHSGERR